MRLRLLQTATLVLVLTCGFIAGCGYANRADAYRQGAREVAGYVEDCTLADAHAGKCSIPCSADTDCIEKNGSRDSY